MSASLALFSGSSSESSVAFGILAKAAFVGANTVNGPGPESVSVRPAAFTAVTSVEKSGFDAAMSTTVLASAIVVSPFIAVVGDTAAVAAGAVVAVVSPADEL